jgi:hypothetical protein
VHSMKRRAVECRLLDESLGLGLELLEVTQATGSARSGRGLWRAVPGHEER